MNIKDIIFILIHNWKVIYKLNNLIRKIQDEVVLCDKRVTGKEAIKGYPKAFLIKLDLQTLKKSPHGQSLKFQQKRGYTS